MTIRTISGRRGSIQTRYTDTEAQAICARLTNNKFAFSLATERPLEAMTVEQIWWLHKIAMEQPVVVAPLDLTAAVAMMTRAASGGLKAPRIRLRTESGQPMNLLLNGASTGPKQGTITVRHNDSDGTQHWYARIERDGSLCRGRECTDEIVSTLRAFCEDPQGISAAYGKQTGHCCYCGRLLEEEGSVRVGYGPVCAQHYGLPHPQNGDMTLAPEVEVPWTPDPEAPAQGQTVTAVIIDDPTPSPRRLNTPAKRAAFQEACDLYAKALDESLLGGEALHLCDRAHKVLEDAGIQGYDHEVRDVSLMTEDAYADIVLRAYPLEVE